MGDVIRKTHLRCAPVRTWFRTVTHRKLLRPVLKANERDHVIMQDMLLSPCVDMGSARTHYLSELGWYNAQGFIVKNMITRLTVNYSLQQGQPASAVYI
jgi:hypothetical protein